MDAVSVQSEQWHQGQLTLKLEGVAGTSEHYWIYVPDHFAFSSESALGAGIRITSEGETVRLAVHFDREEAEVTLAFTDQRARC